MRQSLIFLAGAVVGGVSTFVVKHFYDKKKYGEKIDKIRGFYDVKKQYESEEEVVNEEPEIPNGNFQSSSIDMKQYEGIVAKNKAKYTDEDKEYVPKSQRPYVITSHQFEFDDNYDKVKLTYYDDGVNPVLADDSNDEIIDPNTNRAIEETVTQEFMAYIGDEEPDTLYVRRPGSKIDYKLVVVNDSYEDITGLPVPQE